MSFRLLPFRLIPADWTDWEMPNGGPALRLRERRSSGLMATASREQYDTAADGAPLDWPGTWRRVVVSLPDRYPSWDEMRDFIRTCGLFDRSRDVLMLLPPDEDYINVHPNAFHWWQKEAANA